MLVGGGAADVTDVVGRVAADFPRTALFIIVTTYLVLFALLRSVVLPAKALVMNTLSIVASFGALVWIFQDGNLSSILGFQPLGFVETTQPVILFCVLFGLSMDYEVFLLSRMKEVWDRTGDNTEAVARGLERSGRIVTSAALIVVLVAGSFAFADIVLIKALGVGMAIAVALDATVVRALLVPATMRLLGQVELVDAVHAGALRREPAARPRGRRRGGAAMSGSRRRPARGARATVALAIVAAALAGCAAGAPILAEPDRAGAGRPVARGHVAGRRRSDPRRAAAGRRPARPPDRVVVRHGPPADRRRPPVRLRVRDLPRRAGRVPDLVGRRTWRSPTRPATASSTPSGSRSARPSTAHRAGADGQPTGFDLSLTGQDPSNPATAGRPAWTMTGAGGADRLVAEAAPDEAAAAGSPGGLGLDLTLAAVKPPALHDHDGWIDFGEAGSSYYYSRTAMTRHGQPDARRRAPGRRGRGLVRPPVGRLHLDRRRRVGLVRGEPR